MPPKVTSVKIPSTRLKKSVQSSMKLADRAVAAGKTAVAGSKKALAAAKEAKDKKAIRAAASAVKKNQKTLSRARKLGDELRGAVKLANSMCQLNVLFTDYRYFVPR